MKAFVLAVNLLMLPVIGIAQSEEVEFQAIKTKLNSVISAAQTVDSFNEKIGITLLNIEEEKKFQAAQISNKYRKRERGFVDSLHAIGIFDLDETISVMISNLDRAEKLGWHSKKLVEFYLKPTLAFIGSVIQSKEYATLREIDRIAVADPTAIKEVMDSLRVHMDLLRERTSLVSERIDEVEQLSGRWVSVAGENTALVQIKSEYESYDIQLQEHEVIERYGELLNSSVESFTKNFANLITTSVNTLHLVTDMLELSEMKLAVASRQRKLIDIASFAVKKTGSQPEENARKLKITPILEMEN